MSEMRRSCNFCRQRRMRCNGELPWCGACHERSTPCVYESVGARGRPRRTDSSEANAITPSLQTSSSSSRFERQMIDGNESLLDLKPNVNDSFHTIKDRLLYVERQVRSVMQNREENPCCLSLASQSSSERSLVVLLEQLVHLATGKSLGDMNHSSAIQELSSIDVGLTNKERLSLDQKEAMEQIALTTPQLMQLMELAFTLHPFLSLVVSKTSLLYDHRDGLAYTPLLLIVAAEGLDLGLPDVTPLFNEAALLSVNQLMERTEEDLNNGNYNSTMSLQAMSLCQTLLLLTFRMLNSSQVGRATSYLSLCCQVLDDMWEKKLNETTAEVKMNGVQMANVEEELLCNITWIASSFSMWISLQVPSFSVHLQLKYRLDSNQLPTMEVGRSSLYQLDFMSGNLSALSSQERNGRVLYCLASTHCYIEQYLCDPTSLLSLDTHFGHSNKEADGLVATVCRFLSLKSCLVASTSSHKTVIEPNQIQVILAIAGKTVETAASATANPASSVQSPTSSLQMATVGLQVDTFANLIIAFELLFAFTLPQLQMQDAFSHYFDKFQLTSSAMETIENNKWQMLMTLQSMGILLNQESLSCHQRFAVKQQVDQLTSLVQSELFSKELETGNGVQIDDSNSNNLFSSINNNDNNLNNQVVPPKPRRFSQYYTYENYQHQLQVKSPISPRYFSIPFSEIDNISSHAIFNPFQPQQQQQQQQQLQQLPLMTPTTRNFNNASMAFYHEDGSSSTMPSLSPTTEHRFGSGSDAFETPSSHSLSLHASHRRSQTLQSAIKTEPLMMHYGNNEVPTNSLFSNSPYPVHDFLHADYRT